MEKKKPSFLKVLLIILAVIVGIVLAVGIGATIVINALLNKIPRVDKVEYTLSLAEIESIESETDPDLPEGEYETVAPEDIEMPDEADKIEEEDHIVNILLIGQDKRGGTQRSRSDSMILCTVNIKEKTLVMTSFLRDLYVDIPDHNGISYQDNRLNVCYMYGGMEMLNKALEMNFGVHVDYNFEVDFAGFSSIIDIMGGVGICLTRMEAEHMACGLKEGFNILNGEQALDYARIRAIDSDFGRTNRQRTVMLSLLEQVKRMNIDQILALIDVVFPLVTTDMTNAEIVSAAISFFPLLQEIKVTTQYIPAEGAYHATFVRGMSVLIPDFEANRKILQDTLK